MEKKSQPFLSMLIVIFFLSCSSISVIVDYDKSAVFSDYKTFFFVKSKQKQKKGLKVMHNNLFTKEMMQEIRPILEGKGFKEAINREETDLLVIFYSVIKKRSDFVPPTYRVGRWGRVWKTSHGRVVRYKEGTLIIDIVDRKKKELVWQGIGRGILNRENPAKDFVTAVQKILENFPPEKGER